MCEVSEGWRKGGRGMSQSGQTFIFAAEHITHPLAHYLSEIMSFKKKLASLEAKLCLLIHPLALSLSEIIPD